MTEPGDPGAVGHAKLRLTKSQLRQLTDAIENHPGSVWIEALDDAYVRLVFIDSEGESSSETLIFPT